MDWLKLLIYKKNIIFAMQARILLMALSETGDPFPEEVQCRLHSGMQPVNREVVRRHFFPASPRRPA
ncbi:MAG: hypothetical protein KA535_07710 [Azonexus sp.]|nr:hypothetical protein [Azonexus sp.]